ncbi:hypothetical protein GQ457_04G013650 [Hibiscus cannabinus]
MITILSKYLGKYLGVSLLHSHANTSSYTYLSQIVQSRFNGWTTKNFFLPGKITLAKTVLATIPNYTMQSTIIPRKTCLELERLIKHSIWGNSSDGKGIHMV